MATYEVEFRYIVEIEADTKEEAVDYAFDALTIEDPEDVLFSAYKLEDEGEDED